MSNLDFYDRESIRNLFIEMLLEEDEGDWIGIPSQRFWDEWKRDKLTIQCQQYIKLSKVKKKENQEYSPWRITITKKEVEKEDE